MFAFSVRGTGGLTVVMPLGPSKIYQICRMRAMAMRDAGMSISETARAVGVSTRAVEQWRAEQRANEAQAKRRASLMGAALPGAPKAEGNHRSIFSLPDLLILVADIAGLPVALSLAQAKGSQTVSFTFPAGEEHWLVQKFGRDVADKLGTFFAQGYGRGADFVIPRAPPFLYALVQRRALTMRDEGHSAEDVAREMCVTPAQVEKWCAVERTKAAKRAADAAVAAMNREEG